MLVVCVDSIMSSKMKLFNLAGPMASERLNERNYTYWIGCVEVFLLGKGLFNQLILDRPSTKFSNGDSTLNDRWD